MIRKSVYNRKNVFDINEIVNKKDEQLLESMLQENKKLDDWNETEEPLSENELLILKEELISTILKESIDLIVLDKNEIDDVRLGIKKLSEEYVGRFVDVEKTYINLSTTVIGDMIRLPEENKCYIIDEYIKNIEEDTNIALSESMRELEENEDTLNNLEDNLIYTSFARQKEESLKEDEDVFSLSDDAMMGTSVRLFKLTNVFENIPIVLKEDVKIKDIKYFFTEPLMELM